MTPRLTVIILAGGKSSRMGSDKAFLQTPGSNRVFIAAIVEEVKKFADDVIIAIGRKDRHIFGPLLSDEKVRVVNDDNYMENPLGGILTAFRYARNDYAAVIACDSPFVKSSVIEFLFQRARGHSVAIPIWDIEDKMTTEPLCAVYNIRETTEAINRSIKAGKPGCKHVMSFMSDVQYVPVSDLRDIDPELVSLMNVNTRVDYDQLLEYLSTYINVSPHQLKS